MSARAKTRKAERRRDARAVADQRGRARNNNTPGQKIINMFRKYQGKV